MKLHRPVRLVWPLAAAFALLPGPARADAIRDPPQDCPPGSEGGTGHCGAECYALVCTNDDECPDGTTCQATKACIRVIDCFPEPKHVHGGVCSPEETCAGDGETCQAIDLCLPAGETSSGGSDTGSSTSSGTSSGSTGSGTSSGSTSTGSTSTGSTSSGSTSTSSTSTGSTTTSTSTGSTEGTPTTGGQPGTTGSGTSSSTGGGAGSSTGGGGSGDKGGCAGCGLAEGPHGVLALLVIVGARRRRPRRSV